MKFFEFINPSASLVVYSFEFCSVKKPKPLERYFQGLVVFVAIDCLLGIVDCIYEAADLFRITNANVILAWISRNVSNRGIHYFQRVTCECTDLLICRLLLHYSS